MRLPRSSTDAATPARHKHTLHAPRVAVVGSGLAGLTAAYLLRREGADVWLIEKSQRLGFHAWSVEIDKPITGDVHLLQSHNGFRRSQSANSGLVVDTAVVSAHEAARYGVNVVRTLSPSSEKKAAVVSGASASGYATTSTAAAPTGETVAVDVPMRSFQGGYYPLLIALYKHLGFRLAPQQFTFSFTSLRTRGHAQGHGHAGRAALRPEDTYFIHTGASGTKRPSFPSRAWSSPLGLVRALLNLIVVGICYLALVVTAALTWHNRLPRAWGKEPTFAVVVDHVAAVLDKPTRRLPRTRLGPRFKAFAADIVLPLFSAVGTMTADDVWATPAHYVLDYVHAGLGTDHYSLGGGKSARDVAAALSAPIRAQGEGHVRVGTAIRSIRYRPSTSVSGPGLTLSLDGGDELEVDRVVLATQASAARTLLSTLEPSLVQGGARAEARRVARMRTALGDVQYRDTIVTTHRDRSVLPHPSDVRDINLVQPQPQQATAIPPPPPPPVVLPSSALGLTLHLDTPPLSPTRTRSAASSSSSTPCPSPPHAPVQLVGDPSTSTSPPPFFSPDLADIYTMATHVVPTPTGPVYQTTNPVVPLDAASVLGVARLERALPLRGDGVATRTLAALRPAVPTHGPDSGTRLVHVAGSYAYPGIPLLEGCVGSARRATEDICGLKASAAAGGVDWDAGRGSVLGRAWRWRRDGRGGY